MFNFFRRLRPGVQVVKFALPLGRFAPLDWGVNEACEAHEALNALARKTLGLDDEPYASEAVIAQLKAAGEHYGRGCRFRVGDIVTLRPDSFYHGAGWPHFVLESLEHPRQQFEVLDPQDTGSVAYGAQLDMRVLHIDPAVGKAHPHWVESWQFIPWPSADARPPPPSATEG